MKIAKLSAITAVGVMMMTASCNPLTDEAKQMVGDYYIAEISQDVPLMELKGNGKCVVSAVKPGVLTYSVEGKWNVKNDSLLIDLKPETLKFEGDSMWIGEIPAHRSYYIVSYNEMNLEVKKDDLNYTLHRRVKSDD